MDFVMDVRTLSVLNVSSLGERNLWTYAGFLVYLLLVATFSLKKKKISRVDKKMKWFVFDTMLVRQKSKPKEKVVQQTKKKLQNLLTNVDFSSFLDILFDQKFRPKLWWLPPDKYTDIMAYKLNWPRGHISEHRYIFLLVPLLNFRLFKMKY